MNQSQSIHGKYRHYKGNEYELIDEAVHTETGERLVVYRALYVPHQVWVRPYDMFFESVTVDGKTVPRFEKMSEDTA